MKVYFETFGCRLNRAEALEDEAKFIAAGHGIVDNPEEADVFVIRGCSVTARAQRDSEKAIGRIRERFPSGKIFITGCLKGAKPLTLESLPDTSPVPDRTARAYLKVQDGCSGKCAFCIVPQFRGAAVSEGFDAVLDKAKRFIEAGYHEIVVTGCNLSLYASGGRRLPELIAALAELTPECRIRLGSIEPFPSAVEIVAAMAGHSNVCRFLHASVQSGSDRILRLMNRPYSAAAVEGLFAEARRMMPGIALGCDMIAGFPGESEQDHSESESLLIRHDAVNVHAFPFSSRPGTPAASMAGAPPRGIAVARAKSLAAIGGKNRRAFALGFRRRIVDVVVEDESRCAGWTDGYLWFEGSAPGAGVKRKGRYRFLVREARDGILHGTKI